jgi:filamentous hemagglutinin
MWDLTVDGVHTFYVEAGRASSVLVHNCPIGENGTQVTSKSVWRGQEGRLDVENPAPGVRDGQMHFQDWGGAKAQYNFDNGAFFNSDGSANSTAMNLLYNDSGFQSAVWNGLRYLGEDG